MQRQVARRALRLGRVIVLIGHAELPAAAAAKAATTAAATTQTAAAGRLQIDRGKFLATIRQIFPDWRRRIHNRRLIREGDRRGLDRVQRIEEVSPTSGAGYLLQIRVTLQLTCRSGNCGRYAV